MRTVRLRPDQKRQISAVRKLRSAAANLRTRVSGGTYSDADLDEFWTIIDSAGMTLGASNVQLGERAGVGGGFFTTVVRDRRRPKLTNFLRALSVVVTVGDELLYDIDRAQTPFVAERFNRDGAALKDLSATLAKLARNEIAALDAERPNDPDAAARNRRFRDLIVMFAEGFERIALAITAAMEAPHEPVLLGRVKVIVDEVGQQISQWFRDNAADVADFGIRLPTMVAGVAALGWAGANMTVATTAVAALVGGPKVVQMLKRSKK